MAVKDSLTRGLALHEKEVDVGGAYRCLLTLGSASMCRAQILRQAQLAVGRLGRALGVGRVQGVKLGSGVGCYDSGRTTENPGTRNEAADVPDRVKRG